MRSIPHYLVNETTEENQKNTLKIKDEKLLSEATPKNAFKRDLPKNRVIAKFFFSFPQAEKDNSNATHFTVGSTGKKVHKRIVGDDVEKFYKLIAKEQEQIFNISELIDTPVTRLSINLFGANLYDVENKSGWGDQIDKNSENTFPRIIQKILPQIFKIESPSQQDCFAFQLLEHNHYHLVWPNLFISTLDAPQLLSKISSASPSILSDKIVAKNYLDSSILLPGSEDVVKASKLLDEKILYPTKNRFKIKKVKFLGKFDFEGKKIDEKIDLLSVLQFTSLRKRENEDWKPTELN